MRTYTIFGECLRCAGFARAFSTFAPNAGLCFRCNGSLREFTVRHGVPEGTRAEHIANVARWLDAWKRGEKVAHFSYAKKSDTAHALASAISRAPADVAARAVAAIDRELQARRTPEKYAKVSAAWTRLLDRFTGRVAA